MATLRAIAAVALVGGCSAGAPPAAKPAPRLVDAAAPPADVEDAGTDGGPSLAICGRRSWRRCSDLGASFVTRNDAPEVIKQGLVILRMCCAEGDRRRCFELDTSAEVRDTCAADGLLDACSTMSDLYREGVAQCPYDTACAENLRRMVCVGRGGGEACLRGPDAGP